jgi:hypothetical protein
MKFALALAMILVLAICSGLPLQAETFSYDGNTVGLLAVAISSQAATTGTFPTAYRVPDATGHLFDMPATIAFELLARAVMIWKPEAHFPTVIEGLTFNLQPPTYDAALEPAAGQPPTIPVLTKDIADGAKIVNTGMILKTIQFGGAYRLTAAQFTVAMAMFLSAWQATGRVPESLAIPTVHSPQNWTDVSNPLALVPEKHIDPIALRVLINGIELPHGDTPMPVGLTQPFTGTAGIALLGSGPITKITLALDGVELASFNSVGLHGYSLDTQHLTDDLHLLTITAHSSEADNPPIAIVLSLVVKNGRAGAFTPAEKD